MVFSTSENACRWERPVKSTADFSQHRDSQSAVKMCAAEFRAQAVAHFTLKQRLHFV